MIDVRVTAIGGEQIAAALEKAPEAIRERLLEAQNEAGRTAQARARAAAPLGPTGRLRESIRYFAWGNKEKSELTVRAVGGSRGAPHAHLIERGVPRKRIRVYRKVYASKLQWMSDANRWRFKRPNRVKNRKTFMYSRMHQIRANPFFEPSIQSLGDVGETLQAAVSAAAADVQGGA